MASDKQGPPKKLMFDFFLNTLALPASYILNVKPNNIV